MFVINFSNILEKIMPDVTNGSDEPFIIFRENGGWECEYTQERIEAVKKHDPLALEFKGSDFAKGSYPYVYDKILCGLIRNEYDVTKSRGAESDKYNALVNFIEDYACEFSHTVTDYLLDNDTPLTTLYEIWGLDMTGGKINEPYNEKLADHAVDCIESAVKDHLSDDFMLKKYSFYGYKESCNIKVNNRIIFFGEKPDTDFPFMISEFKADNPLGGYDSEFLGISNDYIEALDKFISFVKYNTDVVKTTQLLGDFENHQSTKNKTENSSLLAKLDSNKQKVKKPDKPPRQNPLVKKNIAKSCEY